MEESSLENGLIIICMELGYTTGQMVDNMRENIKKTKNMVMVYIIGQMVEFTKVGGLEASKMV